jgi:hypothetical protein
LGILFPTTRIEASNTIKFFEKTCNFFFFFFFSKNFVKSQHSLKKLTVMIITVHFEPLLAVL